MSHDRPVRPLRLSRRTFLRGVAGALVGLPVLECMLDAAPPPVASPLRYLVLFGGFSLGCDGDAAPDGYVPDALGRGYDLKPALLPLERVRDEVTVVSGLHLPAARPDEEEAPPAGRAGGGDSFHFHVNPMLSGNRQVGGAYETTVTGPSSDQIVAAHLGRGALFDALALRVQAQFYNIGGADVPLGRDTLSFRETGDGRIAPVAPWTSPRQLFEALFTSVEAQDGSQRAARRAELSRRRSVLDLVDRRMGGLRERLGAADRQRLDEHLTAVRELERRLEAEPVPETGACRAPRDPGADPDLGGQLPGPKDFQVDMGYSGEDERARRLNELLVLALSCDLTRVATLMLTWWQSFMNVHPITGLTWNQHELTHQGTTAELNHLIAWHMGHFADLLERLRAVPEGDATLLDRCAIVFLHEGGHGPAFDGDASTTPTAHTTRNMACLVAGGAGGLRRGEHLVAPAASRHPGNVLLSAMHAVGSPAQRLGEVEGIVPGLF